MNKLRDTGFVNHIDIVVNTRKKSLKFGHPMLKRCQIVDALGQDFQDFFLFDK